MKFLIKFLKDEEGATMAEYALLLGMVSIALTTVISAFRDQIIANFQEAITAFGP